MVSSNLCPIKGCHALAKPNQLMCWPHWRRVPKALDRAVFDTFRGLTNGRGTYEAYRQARSAAIAAVEAKEKDEAELAATL